MHQDYTLLTALAKAVHQDGSTIKLPNAAIIFHQSKIILVLLTVQLILLDVVCVIMALPCKETNASFSKFVSKIHIQKTVFVIVMMDSF